MLSPFSAGAGLLFRGPVRALTCSCVDLCQSEASKRTRNALRLPRAGECKLETNIGKDMSLPSISNGKFSDKWGIFHCYTGITGEYIQESFYAWTRASGPFAAPQQLGRVKPNFHLLCSEICVVYIDTLYIRKEIYI